MWRLGAAAAFGSVVAALLPWSSPWGLVTVFGGSGFGGRHVGRALARTGYRIRVAVRRPDLDLPSLLRKRRLVSIERQPDVVFRQRACRGV